MKKNLLMMGLIPMLSLTGCGGTSKFLVASPSGAPAIALYNHLADEKNYEIGKAENIASCFASRKYQAIIAPTNVGVASINAGAKYLLAANITFGNFYLASTGLDDDGVFNKGDKVLAFQKNGVAGKLFSSVYKDNFNESDATFLADLATVKTKLLGHWNKETSSWQEFMQEPMDYDYVLLAQPVMQVLKTQISALSVYANVQDDYKTTHENNEITQASVFIKKGTNKDKANEFLLDIQNSIEGLLENPELLSEATSGLEAEIVTGKLGGPVQVLKALIQNGNQLGLGYKDARENKENIDKFLETLGESATNEEIYWSNNK